MKFESLAIGIFTGFIIVGWFRFTGQHWAMYTLHPGKNDGKEFLLQA